MKIRKEFYIKGKLWRVEYKWALRHDGVLCDGLYDPNERIIWLRRECSAEDKWLAWLHELIHAVTFESHTVTLVDENTAEVIADAVADVFNDLFKFRWKRKRKQ